MKSAPSDFVNKFLPRELELCKQLQHPNLMRTYDVIKQPNKVIMVTDYASKGLNEDKWLYKARKTKNLQSENIESF